MATIEVVLSNCSPGCYQSQWAINDGITDVATSDEPHGWSVALRLLEDPLAPNSVFVTYPDNQVPTGKYTVRWKGKATWYTAFMCAHMKKGEFTVGNPEIL